MNLEEFSTHIQKAKGSPGGSWWRGLCPAHNDKRPSLYFFESNKTGRIVVRCRTGCTEENILSALNLKKEDLNGDNRIHLQGHYGSGAGGQNSKSYPRRQRDLLEKAIKDNSPL